MELRGSSFCQHYYRSSAQISSRRHVRDYDITLILDGEPDKAPKWRPVPTTSARADVVALVALRPHHRRMRPLQRSGKRHSPSACSAIIDGASTLPSAIERDALSVAVKMIQKAQAEADLGRGPSSQLEQQVDHDHDIQHQHGRRRSRSSRWCLTFSRNIPWPSTTRSGVHQLDVEFGARKVALIARCLRAMLFGSRCFLEFRLDDLAGEHRRMVDCIAATAR